MTARRIGLFGGTFDPPHVGHVHVLEVVLAAGICDEIIVMVAGDPYQKSSTTTLHAAADRLAMAQLAFGTLPRVRVSDGEIRRGGPSFTFDTVSDLREEYGEDLEIVLIIGGDLVDNLAHWHRASELADLVELAIVARTDDPVALPPGWRGGAVVAAPVDVASREVRASFAANKSSQWSVPTAVWEYFVTLPRLQGSPTSRLEIPPHGHHCW